MNRTAVLGLSSGIVFVIANLVAVAFLNMPRAADAAVVQEALVACPLVETALDQGYGVTRTVLRPHCVAQVPALASAAK